MTYKKHIVSKFYYIYISYVHVYTYLEIYEIVYAAHILFQASFWFGNHYILPDGLHGWEIWLVKGSFINDFAAKMGIHHIHKTDMILPPGQECRPKVYYVATL